MKKVTQILQSYFHLRLAVLRALDIEHLSKTEFALLSGLEANAKYRRQANPGLWKPVEIHRLARELGINDGSSLKLNELAPSINELPKKEKSFICRYSSLNEERLLQRLQVTESWQPQELDKLQHILETRFIRAN